MKNEQSDANDPEPKGAIEEYVTFLRENIKWWLAWVILVIVITVLIVLLGSDDVPFIYDLS